MGTVNRGEIRYSRGNEAILVVKVLYTMESTTHHIVYIV